MSKVSINEGTQKRKADNKINNLFLKRWSPRAMSGEKITEKEMKQLLEAARWAPSSYNGQPWRFYYAKKGDEHFEKYLDIVNEFNQSWADKSGALLIVATTGVFEHNGEPDNTHKLSVGAAYENLALQGADMDLVVHGMAGFDYKAAKEYTGMPESHEVICMAAIGKPGNKEDLAEQLQERETPSDRKPLNEISFNGKQ